MNRMPLANRISWGPLLVGAVGLVLVGLGARGYYLTGHFGLSDALSCGLLLVPAALLLLVTAYVIQHAWLVGIIPILFAALLVNKYDSFAVAMGVALVGAVVGPIVRERKQARSERSADGIGAPD